MFHVSLLKTCNATDLQEDQPISHDDAPEVEEPYYEVEKILRWRKVKIKKNYKTVFGAMAWVPGGGCYVDRIQSV